MEQEGQFSISDILGIARRRFWWLFIPALLGPAIGLGLSYLVRPVYTSKAFVLIEQPKVPDKFVTQVVTDQLDARLMTLKEQILSRANLEPIIVRIGLYKDRVRLASMDDKVELLRKSIEVTMLAPEGPSRVPSGFYITARSDSARSAQQVCSEILAMFMAENLKVRQQRAAGTTEFLSEQLEESKQKLDEQDAKLAVFKEKYLGKLPSDEQRNMEMLNANRTRLEAVNQELSQAQQQKIIQESALAQLAPAKASPMAANPTELEKELTALQTQLAALQSRYTDTHPEVRKCKAQIRELQRQMAASASAPAEASAPTAPAIETSEARQMRVALRLTEQVIKDKRAEQARLEQQVQNLQAQLQLSPVVEEQYKALTRDHESALQFYNDLLNKKTQSEMSSDLERREEGEQFGVMDAPDLPAKPSFPDRVKFTLAGLGGGMGLGVLLTLLMERREDFLRTEDSVARVLELPVLVAIGDFKQAEAPALMPAANSGRR
jgi:polysaccharide chain length determinant protein (PEP-CTERM system associated)